MLEANLLIAAGLELLQVVPGRTDDGWPTTLFYLGKPKPEPKAVDTGAGFFDGDWIEPKQA